MTLAIEASSQPKFLDTVPSGCGMISQDLATKLSDQVRAAGSEVPFAKSMLDLIEVTARISQLDELVTSAQAASETESPEARKWKEISAMSAQFARSSLFDRQIAAIDELLDLSARGGSLVKEASDAAGQPAKLLTAAEARAPPPGLPAPSPLLKDTSGNIPPPGLCAPPGLAAPPGLEHVKPVPNASPAAKAAPWRRPPGVFRAPESGAPERAATGARGGRPWAKGAKRQPLAASEQQQEEETEQVRSQNPQLLAQTFTALNFDDYTDDSDDDA